MKFNNMPVNLPHVIISAIKDTEEAKRDALFESISKIYRSHMNEVYRDEKVIVIGYDDSYFDPASLLWNVKVKIRRKFFNKLVYHLIIDPLENGRFKPKVFIKGDWVDHIHDVARKIK